MLQTFIWWPCCIFPYKMVHIFLSSPELLTFFPKFKMVADAILDFDFMCIWPFRRADSVVFVFCTKFSSNICYSHWPSVDDVTRINFRFRLLATWSSPYGRDASYHKIWRRYLYPIRSWYFSKIKGGGRRHLGFVWVARTSCKNFVMIG